MVKPSKPKSTAPATCAEAAALAPFKVGDVVQLKSGGPHLTVEFLDCCTAECIWFDQDGLLRDVSLSFACLRLAEENIPF